MASRSSLARLIDGHRTRLAGSAGLALFGGLAESIVLVALVQAAVALSAHRPAAFDAGPIHLEGVSVSRVLVVAFVATLLRLAAALGVARLNAILVADVQSGMRLAMFEAYIDASWTAQSREREGGLQQMIGVEIDRATGAVLTLATGLSAACTLLMLTVAAFTVSLAAAVGLLVTMAGLFLVLRPLTGRVRRQAAARSSEELGVAQSLNELVRTAEEIRVYGVGEEEKRRVGSETIRVRDWVARLQFTSLSISGLYQATALGLIVVALLVVNELGASNLAGTGAIVLILLRAFAYSQQIQQSYHLVGEHLPSVAIVEERLAVYRSAATVDGKEALRSVDRLEFRTVSYSYRAGHAAINEVSFTVEKGEVIGVVGPSGAGKSTLVQLLLRLRAPDEGHYLVNGRNAAEFVHADWARMVSFLPQQPKLIAGTAADNIRFFREVSADRVETAARKAHLHEEILSWPDGYATVVGHRSDAVSGGQAQRLCLARALATDPELLVLDEPTSALDALSEHYVQRALTALRDRTTIFIIAHRLSTLSICDRVLVLDNGRAEAMATRELLAGSGGFYQKALELSGLT